FQVVGSPSPAQLRALVDLLAAKYSELAADPSACRVVQGLPLVECRDELFRAASEVYWPSKEIALLLGDVPVAKRDAQADPTTRLFFDWLGVAERPRVAD